MIELVLAALVAAQSPVPSLREQAAIQQEWLKARLDKVLPAAMRRHSVDMWIVVCREYNEDPVFLSMVSPTVFAARRRTILVFHDRGAPGVDRLALGGGSNGGLYTVYRDPSVENRELWGEGQWALLRKLVDERKPRRIAINISQTHAFADGLSAGEREKLEEALGPDHVKRFVRSELLALDYLAERLPAMLPVYRRMMESVHSVLSEAFSRNVIEPGRTTNEDVVWWLRERIRSMGVSTWFQPSVRVQRAAKSNVAMLSEEKPSVIERGDVLWVDFGITAMRLNTDTQHMGYVLREGETAPPAGILAALRAANRMQEIVLEELRPARTGNDVLAASLKRIRAEGINGTVYSHPVGDHGHAAGPLIGLWDRQEPIPGRGEVPFRPNTWMSIELAARTPVPEWNGAELFVGLEEDAVLDGNGKASWVLRPQKIFHLIR